ncbi:MAG: glycosyltransferase family 2 protein [Bacteroidota bacterium]
MPQVSILLPFYNAASTLNQAVDSIVNQSLTHWELILVDNASTDGSSLLAEKWAKRDSRIQLTRCEQQGIAHALNQGLELVDSDFIARMDADDVSCSNRLEKQLNFLEENPEVDVIGCQTDFRSSLEKAEGYAHFINWQNGILTPDQHWINRFKESPVAHPTVMFRRALIDQFGP